MEIFFLSGETKEKINFDGKAYGISNMDLFKHEFSYDSENGKITKFKKEIATYEITVNVSDSDNGTWEDNYSHMQDIFERDAWKNKRGKLYVNNCYLKCNVYAGNVEDQFREWVDFQECLLKIVTDYPVWITEQTISILPATAKSSQIAKGYPYGYPYGYAKAATSTSLQIDHYAESDFKLVAYGPATSVYVTIAGHPYSVDYPLEAGEYMVIDSRDSSPSEERIYVVRNNGDKVNVFNYRDAEHSVFKKIPPGNITIDYPRTYGIDLTIFIERSEPKWK